MFNWYCFNITAKRLKYLDPNILHIWNTLSKKKIFWKNIWYLNQPRSSKFGVRVNLRNMIKYWKMIKHKMYCHDAKLYIYRTVMFCRKNFHKVTNLAMYFWQDNSNRGQVAFLWLALKINQLYITGFAGALSLQDRQLILFCFWLWVQ